MASTEYTMLLLGKTGSGKSATGNTILGRVEFPVSPIFHITKTSQIETCERDGKTLKIVDTPDITESLDHIADKDPAKEVAKWLEETKLDGIDAILLVHKFGVRFTDQQKSLYAALEKYFGKDVYKHIVVVFTFGDQLDIAKGEGKLTDIEEYVSEEWGGLPNLMKKVDRRYVVFNNRYKNAAEDKNQSQVRALMELVERVSKDHGRLNKRLTVAAPDPIFGSPVDPETPRVQGRFKTLKKFFSCTLL